MKQTAIILVILLFAIPFVIAQTDTTGTGDTGTTGTTGTGDTGTTNPDSDIVITTVPLVFRETVVPEEVIRSGVTLRFEDVQAFVEANNPDPEVYLPPEWATDETFALVSVDRANLRSLPNVETGEVRNIATWGDRFPVIGIYYPGFSSVIDPGTEQLVFDDPGEREVWYLIDVGNGAAWIFGGLVIVANPETLQAFIDGRELTAEEQAQIDVQLRASANTVSMRYASRLRAGPGTNFSQVGIVPFRGRVAIIGRNAVSTWFYINYNGQTGWVNFSLMALPDGFNAAAVPIVQ